MNEEKKVVVNHQMGDSGIAITWIFTMLTMEFWGIYAGIFDGPTTLAVGAVQLGVYAPYLITAIVAFKSGNNVTGNIFLIFATAFGGVGGSCNLVIGIAAIKGFEINAQMSAIPFIWCGIMIIPLMIIVRSTADKVTQICYFCATLFLIGGGLVTLNVLPAAINPALMVLGFITAVSGLYASVAGFLVLGGCKGLPCGKPFCK